MSPGNMLSLATRAMRSTCAPMWMAWALLLRVLSYFSRVWLFGAQWTVSCKAPLSMGFSRQEYWRG